MSALAARLVIRYLSDNGGLIWNSWAGTASDRPCSINPAGYCDQRKLFVVDWDDNKLLIFG